MTEKGGGKNSRSKLGKPVFTTDQHWLQGRQAGESLGSEKQEEEEGREE